MHIRNFVIIAHIDHGKSTLADRFLEITGTVESRKMRPQYLDRLELERERGITIKMAPVRMTYHSDRGLTQTNTRTDADSKLLYEDITYKIQGCIFDVKKNVGLGHKEVVYQKALVEEFRKASLRFEREKIVEVFYEGKKLATYRPDFVIEEKIILEVKVMPFLGQTEEKQLWSYLKSSEYKLALLVNFGGKDVEIRRIVYETARPRESASDPRKSAGSEYILNLIDTPGHSDFSYEVSRALAAVEGAILLVDATKGIQAQTLSNLRAAQRAGLAIIGAVNKVDLFKEPDGLFGLQVSKSVEALAKLLEVPESEIFLVSGKTGEGAEALLHAVIEKVPPPSSYENTKLDESTKGRMLIFDSLYDDHKGILAFVRVFGGKWKAGDHVYFLAKKISCNIKEIGSFIPELAPVRVLASGEIGYIATGLKEPALIQIGDTIVKPETGSQRPTFVPSSLRGDSVEPGRGEIGIQPLPGYREPAPVVFISFFPDDKTKFDDLKRSLAKLRLTDAALSLTPDANEALGRGFKIGFLGQLHFEITASRLRDEFNLEFITSFPSVAYLVQEKGKEYVITQAKDLPVKADRIFQPMINIDILAPREYLNQIVTLKNIFDFEILEIRNIGENVLVIGKMPLSELLRDFDDHLKSLSSGYASFSYELAGEEAANIEKMEILLAGEVVPALTRIVSVKDLEREARSTVERLKNLLPAAQFAQAIQARAQGRIIARETIPATRKDVTGYLYGGDRTRKMKLWKKQKRGKEKLKSLSKISIPIEVFREILRR